MGQEEGEGEENEGEAEKGEAEKRDAKGEEEDKEVVPGHVFRPIP